jgi:hypothetical protein
MFFTNCQGKEAHGLLNDEHDSFFLLVRVMSATSIGNGILEAGKVVVMLLIF